MNHLAKAYYASPEDCFKRIPELSPLQNKSIAVFGLGCIGAPSVIEFAKAGTKELHILDFDDIDPASTVRWPLGFSVTGRRKTDVLKEFIENNYPYTKCISYNHRIGSVRSDLHKESDILLMNKLLDDADLIYDATTEIGVNQYFANEANLRRIPYIGLEGTWGGWGGKVFCLRPYSKTACWFCYETACENGTIKNPPSDESDNRRVQPLGCGDPTFKAAGFDMLHISLTGVRMAVSVLCENSQDGYPSFEEDAVHIWLRDENGKLIQPKFDSYKIRPTPNCSRCNQKTNE